MNNIPIPILLIMSLLSGLLLNVSKKLYSGRGSKTILGSLIYSAVTSFVAAAVLLCYGGFGAASTFTVLLAIAFGTITAIQSITNIVALGIGPMSYTQVIISFSTLISALSGAVFFNETLGWSQIVGIILMLTSFVFATEKKKDEKSASFKWLALCIIAFLVTGGIGIMQKIHQSSDFKSELNAFLIIAFVTSGILSFIFSIALSLVKGDKKHFNFKLNKPALVLISVMVLGGISIGLVNKFCLYLSGVMDSAVFFPTVNGGTLVLTTLVAVVLFKERLTVKQWLGIAFGITAVVFLCNPFS